MAAITICSDFGAHKNKVIDAKGTILQDKMSESTSMSVRMNCLPLSRSELEVWAQGWARVDRKTWKGGADGRMMLRRVC